MEPFNTLAKRWQKDAEQYMRQVEEARQAGTPYDQMLSMATALRQCSKDLTSLIQKETSTLTPK